MKKKNNKKGFTLIELLAVIVILAIITVIGITTILPYIQDSGKKAFAVEANHAITAASDAIDLINLGRLADDGYSTANGYCFTLSNLVSAGLWQKDASDLGTNGYEGIVEATKNGNIYTYHVQMHNKDYYVNKNGGMVDSSNVNQYTSGVSLATTCTGGASQTLTPEEEFVAQFNAAKSAAAQAVANGSSIVQEDNGTKCIDLVDLNGNYGFTNTQSGGGYVVTYNDTTYSVKMFDNGLYTTGEYSTLTASQVCSDEAGCAFTDQGEYTCHYLLTGEYPE